jgi:acyl carrier protein
MSNPEIEEALKKIIKPYIKNEEGFKNIILQTNFMTDLQINSANLVDIVLDVEEHFSIEIDNESMEKMFNVENSIAIISQKLSEK